MPRYVEGSDRDQVTLLPECLDDYIPEDNPVRAVDAFVEELDTKHHLIVAHEVTNVGNDRGQLANMADQARSAMGKKRLDAIADRGYFSGPRIKACEEAGITSYVPKPMTSNSAAAGRFSKADFIHIQRDDEYQCPAGERLRWRQPPLEKGLNIHSYWSDACRNCALRAQCTTGRERRVCSHTTSNA